MEPISFLDYLRKVRKENFREQMELYCRENPRAVRAAVGCPEAEALRLCGVSALRAESMPGQSIAAWRADVIVRGDFTLQEDSAVPVRRSGLFRLRYVLDLRPCRGECCGPVIAPADSFPRDGITEQNGLRTDGFFLPVLAEADYPTFARRVLEQYQPAALRRRNPADGIALAFHLGLKIRRVRFEAGSRVRGRILFEKTQVPLRDREGRAVREEIEPMTVLLNTNLCRTEAEENATLVHECCHRLLDLPFFLLQRMAGRTFAADRAAGRGSAAPYGPVDRMERQAVKLTACILLEETRTRREIRRLLEQRGSARSPENMAFVLEQLARVFRVTRSMARIRMTELGWPEAEGVFGWLDGRRVPDHGCGGTWLPGRTYTISFAEASRLYANDRGFAGRLATQAYVYAEGHFCRNEERYVTLKRGALPVLTDYARHHIDECCIPFVRLPRCMGSRDYTEGQAAHLQNNLRSYGRLRMDDSAGDAARGIENRRFTESAAFWAALRRELAGIEDAGEAVRICRTARGLSQQALADELGIHRKTLAGWLVRGVSVPHLAALCVAMQLRGDVGRELFRACECRWRGVEHREIYEAIIENAQSLTIWRCDELLAAEGLPPLIAGQSDALVG